MQAAVMRPHPISLLCFLAFACSTQSSTKTAKDVSGAAPDAAAPGADLASDSVEADAPPAPDDVSDDPGTLDVPPPGPVPGVDAELTPFDATPIYFAGEDNKRSVDSTAAFPEEGTYASIALDLELSCPSGGCDPWDRRGSLGVVTAVGADGAPDTVVEVARFITPFGVGMSGTFDLTDLRPLLKGTVTLRAFIDTWVGPGSQYGDGWLLSAKFRLTGGIPARVPLAVVPIFTERSVVYGDPDRPVGHFAPAFTAAVPVGTTAVALRSFITGHGQGNAANCAEFCGKEHTFVVGGTPTSTLLWRDDCVSTAAPKQQGSWQYPRAGWCPGANVHPWTFDVALGADQTALTVGYAIEPYENTCRPNTEKCTGCAFGNPCEYDGGMHTEPFFQLSTLLIAYQ